MITFIPRLLYSDFSDEFANLTLSERPNALYSWTVTKRLMKSTGSQPNPSTDSEEVDSDSGYSSPLHRRNLVSNGTHAVSRTLMNACLMAPPPDTITTTQPLITYALVAQKSPSHKASATPPPSQSNSVCDNKTRSSSQSPHTSRANSECEDGQKEGKKKRRRNRRRKRKKSKDGEDTGCLSDAPSGMGRTFSSSNVSRTSEGTLHFEDEAEFPELGVTSGGGEKQPAAQSTVFSYSDILKNVSK